MRRRSSASVAANPVLVGAVAVLVVVVAVFLAYNANQGLPFVPTREYRVQMTNGANLLPSAEVKVGGQRIGFIEALKPVPLGNGDVGAELRVKLDESAGDIPVDSTWRVRPKSPIGLKYIELVRGRSPEALKDNALVPASQTSFAAELNDYQSIFDAPTRAGVRRVLKEGGNTFALRGGSLNRTIEDLPRLFRHLEPVARTLADPDTQLARLLRELGDAARVVAPVADAYSNGFSAGADAFEAWSRDEDKLAETIRETPGTLAVSIPSLRAQRPALVALRDNARAMERLADALPSSAPVLAKVLEEGRAPLRRSVEVYNGLEDNLAALRQLVRDPATEATFVGLRRLGDVARPLTRHVGPYVTVCNYFNYAVTHLGEHVTEPDPTGTSQRTLFMLSTGTPIGSLGQARPANGERSPSGTPINLHTQPYGAAISATGEADCEGGQRGYMRSLDNQSGRKREIVRDMHVPGNQGPTYTGRPRVPDGQTFDRNPRSGPPLPAEVDYP